MQNGRVYTTDDNQSLNRPGPRIVGSVGILAEFLHPDCFDFGYQEKEWIPGTYFKLSSGVHKTINEVTQNHIRIDFTRMLCFR